MPSITSNDHPDSNDNRRSRGDRDGMRDNEKMKGGHVTKNLSPFDLQYVDPIVQHPTTDTYNTFERNLNTHGLQLHSLMSKDDLNEFWEASLCGGNFNERIVVRSLSGKATVDLLEEFRKFMISLHDLPDHPNIWSVHGISKEKLPYRICYEYHDQATVRDYLLGNFQSHGDSDSPYNQTQTLVILAYQIVDAMVFLKSYAFDHVAIRTEKILLDHTEDCKLYDFSASLQSQQIALNACRENQILPWLAPELIFLEEYNQWTDIWAFGVVLWELWCGGRTPHCGKSRENLEKDLRNQQFLVQPPDCPGAVYSLMLSCWKNNASERKMFIDLKKDIDNLRTATESSCYGPQDYSTVGASSFYTVLDNTYDAN